VIRSFGDRDTERVFLRERIRTFDVNLQRLVQRKLAIIDAAESLGDLRFPPGNRLEKLAGERKGQHSIRINDRWRIGFRWRGQDAFDVEIVDYH
jgi:proteic killer suppression protein